MKSRCLLWPRKLDEAFQVPENKAYACREKHEMIQAEALEREMEAFHRRRILCMVEIFSKIDCGILFSGYVELDTYFKNVWDYAHQRIAAEQLREVQEYLRSQIPWKSPIQSADESGGRTSQLLVRRR